MQWVKRGVKFVSYLLNGTARGVLAVATGYEVNPET
jgi:hypothetical protein